MLMGWWTFCVSCPLAEAFLTSLELHYFRRGAMDVDKAIELIGKTETDYEIKSRVPRGLMILMTFDSNIECRFEHDQMWACDFEETVTKMEEGDVEQMARLGWFEDEEAWSHFS